MTTPDAPTTLHALDPQLIDLDPTQPRQEIDPIAQAELAASVREYGVRIPIAVVPTGDGRYRLLYGERRLRAAQACALPTLPCLVTTPPTALDALDLQLVENLCRSELRPLELAQGLWRGILGAQITALEAERADDGKSRKHLLASDLTPVGQIAALEARLCALAGVAGVGDYFGGGRVRVPRAVVLARYGMAEWSASRLKKLFQTLSVAPTVQDMLAGVDVSARALRDLAKHDEAAQAALVTQARTTAAQGNGDLGSALRNALDEQADDHDEPQDELALLPTDGVAHAFTPDPSLALLTTTGGSAPKLVTDRPAPTRGSTPPMSKAGEWSDDGVLQLEAALEAALHLFDDVGVLRFNESQIARLQPLWSELIELMQHALGEA